MRSVVLRLKSRPAAIRTGCLLLAGAMLLALCEKPAMVSQAHAQAASRATAGTGLPVPRFVSLKAGRVNVRTGPGEDYRIAWVFTRPGLPIEVIQEYDTWRRIRDSDGTVGWVFQSLLSGRRTAVVAPWANEDPRPIRSRAAPDAAITAYLEPGVMAEINNCREGWCRLNGEGFRGWIAQDQLWGVYPGEEVD